MNPVTYSGHEIIDPDTVDIHQGDDMGGNQKTDPAETYVLDEDVMDEMENVEATVVLPETQDELAETLTQKNKFLEDIGAATVVLNDVPAKKH